jgi:hypothetical protein
MRGLGSGNSMKWTWLSDEGTYAYAIIGSSLLVVKNMKTGRHFSFCGGTLAQNHVYFSLHEGFRSSGAVLPTWSVSTWENPGCDVVEQFLLALWCCDAKEGAMQLAWRESAGVRKRKVCLTLDWCFEYASAGGVDGQILDLSGSIVFESFREVFQAHGRGMQGWVKTG